MDQKTKNFLKIEFVALGDMTHDGLMNYAEFERLMKLLGFDGSDAEIQRYWDNAEKHGDKMDMGQYEKFMADPQVHAKTDKWRKVFAIIDGDGSGLSTPEEFKAGMRDLGVKIAEEDFQKVDLNHDGKIDYSEFLKKQLHQKN